jgi:hypothetical protein
MDPDELDVRAGRIAARQFGLLTGTRALEIGFTRPQIRVRIRRGRWIRVARDVFQIAGTPPSWQADVLIACFAGPPSSVAGFASAGGLWRIADHHLEPDIIVPRSSSGRLSIARVHRIDLDPRDVTRIGVIPVTRVPRTLIDLASSDDRGALERAVDNALNAGLTSPGEIDRAIERAQRAPGLRGIPALREALAVWTDPIRPGSQAEARLIRRLASWRFPDPVRQHVVRDLEGRTIAHIDVAWPVPKVGLEYDGVEPHGPRHFEPDEDRHQAVEALGWKLVHADRFDLRPGERRLYNELAPLLGRPAA